MLRHARRYAPAALLVAAFVGCAPEDKKAGLIVAVQTDMSIPKDVDTVEIEVSTYGNVLLKNAYDVGEGGLSIPATLTILPGDEKSQPVTIRVISYQGGVTGTARTLRKVITTVPDNREALLRMPIQWLCDGQVEKAGADAYTSSCPDEGESCVAGECVSNTVDVATLPTYGSARVFGGNADGKGVCFDTVPCMAQSQLLDPTLIDLTTCTVPLSVLNGVAPGGTGGADSGSGGRPVAMPVGGTAGMSGSAGGTTSAGGASAGSGGFVATPAGGASTSAGGQLTSDTGRGTLAETTGEPTLNFALSFPPGGDGICGKGDAAAYGCFIPLDHDAEAGWVVDGDAVRLPTAVCERITSAGSPPSLVASSSCTTKTPDIPTCGAWSSVSSDGSITVPLPGEPGGTGGSPAGTGGGSAGNTGAGGTATGAGGTVQADGGGYFVSGTWQGYPRVESVSASVAPTSFAGEPEGAQLCIAGTVSPAADSSSLAMVAVNLNQARGTSTTVGTVIPSRSGIWVDIDNLMPTTPLRVQIQGPNGDVDENERWCAVLPTDSPSTFVPWTDFNTTCWDGLGVAYDFQSITMVGIVVPGDISATRGFDFCLNAITEGDITP